MKFSVNKNDLVDCLKKCNSLINSVNLNPTLTAVHIIAKDNKIVFIASNGPGSYKQTINNVTIDEPGDILVKAKLLYSYISKINQETITINQIDEKILQIHTPNFSTEINLIDNTSFPIIDFDHSNWKQLSISFDVLQNISNRIKPFVSTSFTNANPSACGILFNPIDDKTMECVASDSFRIAYYKFNYSGESNKFVLEPKLIDMAMEIISNNKNKDINLYLSDKECILNFGEILIKYNLLDTKLYPNIINAILSKPKYSFTIKLNELIDALDRGSLFVLNEQWPISNFKLENGKINIKFISNEIGNSLEKINLIDSNIENFEIKLNQKLLLSLLTTIKSENVTFNFNNSNSPIIISSNNPEFLNLIVPLRG